MPKVIRSEISLKDLLYSIPGYACFLYLLLPFRFWEPFVFSNQIETVVVTTFFASVMAVFAFAKQYQIQTFRWSKTDVCLTIYGIYLLCRLKYPLEKEVFFTAFSILCMYLYFRNFPVNCRTGLLFLIPIAGIVQMIDGINRFSMPWQNLSHITGIFNNTGLFGGFAALGFVVCTGLLFFSELGRLHLKSIVLPVLSIPLAVQTYASESRASWVATLVVILFLLYRFAATKNIFGILFSNNRKIRRFPFLCLFVFFIPFSMYLYGLKKDSANGRLLIARVSMEMVREAPVLGYGVSGFKSGYMNHQVDYFRTRPDSPFRTVADDVEMPFNEFLKILVEQGITGLLLFFFLLYFLFTDNPRSSAFTEICHSSIILFILIFGLFSYPFDKLPFVVLFVAAFAALSEYKNPAVTVQIKKLNGLRISILLVLCLAACKTTVDAHRYAKDCKAWNRALVGFASGREESLSQLENLYPALANNPVFLTTFGKALSYGGHHRKAATVLENAAERLPRSDSYIELGKCCETIELFDKAIACWEQAGLMVPARFTPIYLTMKLHFNNGEYEPAQEYARQLLDKKIKIDNPAIDAMKKEAEEILNAQLKEISRNEINK